MYVTHDEKKNTVIIEATPKETATMLAALGCTSQNDLIKSHNVDTAHLANNYAVFKDLDEMYDTLKEKDVF
ncbi:hypothetical protein [Bacillus pretiosus]|uniref:Uncharacterized protein n=1 Tax=Bacillus pretiosus TaxID=2983392 RepID=A0ABT3EYV4_9BACI|nr:hypothetical protein [Bacillus pretiosus]MCW1241968.1 hypothetical protein [Bacillus pretiosus]